MSLARLVVIDGPDVGCEFVIPARGGGLGRGEDNAIQLSDIAVSRSHCRIERRGERLALVDHGSRNRTLVDGKPISEHLLEEGDEISIGKSRLAFLPPEGGLAVVRQALPSRVTMEIGSGELLRRATDQLTGARAAPDDRARRHLASLAGLGTSLGAVADRPALARTACETALSALAADRAFLVQRDAGGGVTPIGASVSPDDGEGAQLSLPRDVIDKVLREGVALAADTGGRAAVAAPIARSAGATGLLLVDRREGEPWDDVDVMAVGCVAHLVSAALASLEAREALAFENRDLTDKLGGGEFIGQSARARSVIDFVGKVGPTDATVLLTGESGSGKEMVARAVHRASRRSGRAFVAVNCAALTETLLESELFGHERGAFTGATERKLGRFELADGGTLFLDEVGELPMSCQTRFLRVLEEKQFERVGGTRSIAVDVRVVAATNRDLAAMVQRGQFRDDLYYRLSVIHTEVPPLRERAGDIPELAEHFLARLRSQVARRVTGFAPEAMRALCAHPWPGNVRELRNAVERAIVLGEGEVVDVRDLPPHMAPVAPVPPTPTAPFAAAPQPERVPAPATSEPAPAPPAPGPSAPPAQAPPPRSLKDLEREGIVAALAATGGNKAQAASILQIDRSTLYKKIRDYGLDP